MKSEDITGGLDLLGDWLDAKGYTEEAGLCTKAMDEINALREECSNLKNELAKWVNYWRDKDVKALRADMTAMNIAYDKLCEENSRLREAGKDVVDWWLRDGMNKFDGAPAAMFSLRAALGDTK